LLDASEGGGVTGCGLKKTKIHKIRVLGSQMVRAGKKVSGRENVIELAEGIHDFRFGYVVGKREGSHWRFVQGVLKTLVKIKTGFSEGAAKVTRGVESRRTLSTCS